MKFDAQLLQRIKDNDKTLTTVDLSNNSLEAAEVKALAEALKVNKTLTTVDLSYSRLFAKGGKVLAEALKVNKTLTTVNLQSNYLGSEGGKALAEVLKLNKTLTTVNLSNNHLGAKGIKALAGALKVNKALTTVCLSYTDLGAEGAKALGEALKQNNILTTFELVGNSQDANANKVLAEALAEVLKENRALTSIYLEGTTLGSEGGKALAEALKKNKTLTTVTLRSNQLGAEGGKALAEALKKNKTLTTVTLRSNHIGAEGAKALAEALKMNKTLLTVELDDNHIGAEGAKALAEALKKNKTLTMVGLDDNHIGAEGAKALAEALKKNKTLTMVGLDDNQLGAEGAEALMNNQLNARALLTAAKTGNIKQVKRLLKAGAALNYCDDEGNTALHLAAAGNHQAVVDLLRSQPHQVILHNKEKKYPKGIQPGTTINLASVSSNAGSSALRAQPHNASADPTPPLLLQNYETQEYYQALINNQKQQLSEITAVHPELNVAPNAPSSSQPVGSSVSAPNFMQQLREIVAPKAAQQPAEDAPRDADAKKIKDWVLGANTRQREQNQAEANLHPRSAQEGLAAAPAPVIPPPVIEDEDSKQYLTSVAQAIENFLQTPSLPDKPRPHQVQCLQNVAAQLKAGLHHGYINMATGTGKSFIAALLIRILADYYQKNQRPFKALVVAPKLNLAKQLAETFISMGKFKQKDIQEISSATGAKDISTRAPICLTIYNSLLNKQNLFLTHSYSIVIFDEAHWLNGEQIRKLLPVLHHTLIQRSPCSLVFSLTATPLMEQPELSGQEVFTYLARQGIKEKMLVPLTWVTFSPLLTKVPAAKEEKFPHLSKIIADILLNYRDPNGQNFWNRKSIIFVNGRKNAQTVSDQLNRLLSPFNQNKAVANYVISAGEDNTGQSKQNKQIIEEFQAGKFFILVNVGICTEGFDDKAVQIVIDLTPNKNEKMAIQKAGRALRICDGKSYAVYLQLILGELPYDYESQQLDEGQNYPSLDAQLGLTRRNDSKPIAEVDDSYYLLNCRSLDKHRKALASNISAEQLLVPVAPALMLPALRVPSINFFPPAEQAVADVSSQKRPRELDELSSVSKKQKVGDFSLEHSLYKSKQDAHDLYAQAKAELLFGQKKQGYLFFEQAKQRYKEIKPTLTGPDLQKIEKRLTKIKAKQAQCLQ